jgi:hypothetical protein
VRLPERTQASISELYLHREEGRRRCGGRGEGWGEGRGERVRRGSIGELYVTTVGVSARRSIDAATRKARSTSPTLAKALIRELTVCVSGGTPCCCMSW